MKRFYLALAMLAALPAASAQTILNEGFETTSTDQYSPNFPDGWSTVYSYTGNNDRYLHQTPQVTAPPRPRKRSPSMPVHGENSVSNAV